PSLLDKPQSGELAERRCVVGTTGGGRAQQLLGLRQLSVARACDALRDQCVALVTRGEWRSGRLRLDRRAAREGEQHGQSDSGSEGAGQQWARGHGGATL